jgi:hypothetical protein
LTCDDPALLVGLRRVAAGVWMFEQMAGPDNAAPPEGAQAALLRDLAAADLRMVAIDAAAALSRFDHDVLRARERLIEAGLGDPLEDDEGERAARGGLKREQDAPGSERRNKLQRGLTAPCPTSSRAS